MATKKRGQKIFIWVIAITMLVGSIGTYFLMILANDNAALDQQRLQEAQAEYTQAYQEHQEKISAQAEEMSDEYYDEFKKYEKKTGKFSADDVKELKKKDIVKGESEELTQDSTFLAYYIGWTPDGKVFDSSLDEDGLKPPFAVAPGSVIVGWTEGLAGMKKGGVRELTIPAEQAYGEGGQGDIPPNTPLKFIVFAPDEDVIPEPQPSEELMRSMGNGL